MKSGDEAIIFTPLSYGAIHELGLTSTLQKTTSRRAFNQAIETFLDRYKGRLTKREQGLIRSLKKKDSLTVNVPERSFLGIDADKALNDVIEYLKKEFK